MRGMQRVEIRDEQQALLAYLARCLTHKVGPVVAAARDQSHAITIPLNAEAIAVYLISCSHSGLDGTAVDLMGVQNSTL